MRPAAARVRWDRLARVTLIVVLAIVAGLWVQNGIALIGSSRAASRQSGEVKRLQQANASLEAQEHALQNPAVIERDARALGMVGADEHSYVVTGLPGR